MNRGTIIRLILAIALAINDGAIIMGVAEINDPTFNQIYKWLSLIATFVIIGINHYYNNDYSEEACIGTGTTRLLKEQKKLTQQGGKIIGEDFGEDLNNEFEGI